LCFFNPGDFFLFVEGTPCVFVPFVGGGFREAVFTAGIGGEVSELELSPWADEGAGSFLDRRGERRGPWEGFARGAGIVIPQAAGLK
jgi:hypothetical protein